MLPREERRRLREIEHQLIGDDPKLARRLTDTGLLRRVWARFGLYMALAAVSAVLAVVCLFLGDGAGLFLCGALAVVLLVFRNWHFQAE